MFFSLSYKSKQFFFVIIKLSIVVGACYFIYKKLADNPDLRFNDFYQFLTENDVFSLKNIFFLLFLTIFNWFFEILKWQKLVSLITKIRFKIALEQSLGALTASLFTPNRIGEYGAKVVYYVSTYRKKIVLLNLLGNIAQMSVTLILGIIGISCFVITYDVNLDYLKLIRFFIILLLIVSFIGFGIKKSNITIKGYSIDKVFKFIKDLPFKTILITFLFSLLRYLIFSFQFYYFLIIFGINISYFDAMIVITSMYLLTSIIPSIFIFDVVIKGSVGVFLFSIIGVNELTILNIITLMWLLNFVLPSLFGSYYVLNFNLPEEDIE
ncbi:hypothetical protein RXV94_02850 [Yeosuana sp. MJ-SS3]|uniref:Flippase-like domain-containing protein n=1 Tax=Gilvirhabdus luticola TaxID=3079858 RepID=A0ABU3U3V1_9FLAO|nr:hypothetical protein [Yeosuana sp. MJ-SS3]MDU8885084.1 hypothetical protein [Yeosuana sp. MJ-SS3]